MTLDFEMLFRPEALHRWEQSLCESCSLCSTPRQSQRFLRPGWCPQRVDGQLAKCTSQAQRRAGPDHSCVSQGCCSRPGAQCTLGYDRGAGGSHSGREPQPNESAVGRLEGSRSLCREKSANSRSFPQLAPASEQLTVFHEEVVLHLVATIFTQCDHAECP